MDPSRTQDWRRAVPRAQQRRNDSLVEVPGILRYDNSEQAQKSNVTTIPKHVLSAEDLEITRKDPEHLLASIAAQEVSSVAVSSAFLRRAALAQELVSCLSKFFSLLDRSWPGISATSMIMPMLPASQTY